MKTEESRSVCESLGRDYVSFSKKELYLEEDKIIPVRK